MAGAGSNTKQLNVALVNKWLREAKVNYEILSATGSPQLDSARTEVQLELRVPSGSSTAPPNPPYPQRVTVPTGAFRVQKWQKVARSIATQIACPAAAFHAEGETEQAGQSVRIALKLAIPQHHLA
jgi:hypothetical protein